MTKFILGTKQNMTQFFDESGRAYPAKLISAGPVVVIQLKTKEIPFGLFKTEMLQQKVETTWDLTGAGTGILASDPLDDVRFMFKSKEFIPQNALLELSPSSQPDRGCPRTLLLLRRSGNAQGLDHASCCLA